MGKTKRTTAGYPTSLKVSTGAGHEIFVLVGPEDGADKIGRKVIDVMHGGLGAGDVRPIPMLIYCPECGARHIDEEEWATRPHHTHSCQRCGMTWRPSVINTVGVRFLPGFKNKVPQ